MRSARTRRHSPGVRAAVAGVVRPASGPADRPAAGGAHPRQPDAREVLIAEPEVQGEPAQHADPGRCKSPAPTARRVDAGPRQGVSYRGTLRQPAANEWRNESTEIDPHVEDGESSIPTAIAGTVQLSDHCRHIGFEEPGADDDQTQSDVERGHRLQSEHEMPGGNDDAADDERTPRADEPIGEIAAEQGREKHKHRVPPIERIRLGVAPSQHVHEIQHQDRPHAVVGEPLPHLDKEQQRQAAWLAEQRAVVVQRGGRSVAVASTSTSGEVVIGSGCARCPRKESGESTVQTGERREGTEERSLVTDKTIETAQALCLLSPFRVAPLYFGPLCGPKSSHGGFMQAAQWPGAFSSSGGRTCVHARHFQSAPAAANCECG